jgi:hypothetical protein
VTGQRSNQLSYVPRLHFQQLGYVPHRMRVSQRSPVSLFFYHFAALDSISGRSGHQTGHQNCEHDNEYKFIRWVEILPMGHSLSVDTFVMNEPNCYKDAMGL